MGTRKSFPHSFKPYDLLNDRVKREGERIEPIWYRF